ncbi:MAG: CHAP domain-containing protein [Actinobacteria bacterium]|nr:CHAP domain-containing protein [Actinomycetota bacterium]
MPHSPAPSRRLALALLALVTALPLALAPGVAAQADGSCSGDSCDGFQWMAARGADNSASYWGMDAGHNCTNYVAWKLTSNGVAKPTIGLGDAADWASRATAAGYPVNSVPTVGAVAQWDSYAAGNGAEGHVAYVESVNADGTILVSEDYWHGGDQTGPLTFRTVDSASVSHFIHLGDVSQWMRLAGVDNGSWRVLSTTLSVNLTELSAVNMGKPTPLIVYSESGELFQAQLDRTGWTVTRTGLTSRNTSMSAVNMGGGWPQVATVDGGTLYLSTASERGWQKTSTGLRVNGEISAVNMSGDAPTIMIAQRGWLYVAARAYDGWTVMPTGLAVTGKISAVNTGSRYPEVFAIEDGQVIRAWAAGAVWRKEYTGVAATDSLSAVTVAGVVHILVNDSGTLTDVFHDESGWHSSPTGVASSAQMTAVDMGGLSPLVIQAG